MSGTYPPIDVKDAAKAGWIGARDEGQLPVHARDDSHGGTRAGEAENTNAKPAGERSTARTWLGRVLRVTRDLAIAVGVLVGITVAPIAVFGPAFMRSQMHLAGVRGKVLTAEAARPFAMPADPSITPLDAGRALSALQPVRSTTAFPALEVTRAQTPWNKYQVTATMFPTARPTSYGGPDNRKVLEAAAKGFSPEEMAFLKNLATAPVWRDFDRVARAPGVDIIGGEFVLPFTPEATASDMPILRFAATKELAYAAVSRAAYHMAIGQRDSAEAVLRSIISYGFTFIDNGTNLIDQLIGKVIVEIGRDGLEHYYVVTGNPNLVALRAATPPSRSAEVGGPDGSTLNAEQMRARLIDIAADPKELRGLRFTSLRALSFTPCMNVRDLLFGIRPEVRDAFTQAKRDLARFPGDRALLELIERTTDRDPGGTVGGGTVGKFLLGASTISGAVLNNPRLPACTRMLMQGGGLP